MTFFPEASSAQQSLLMTALLAVLIFDIFSLFTAFSNEKRRLYGLIDSGLFLLLFVTLTVLANSFYKIHEENSRGILFPLPMWLLWCVTGAAFVFLIIENIVRYRGRNERLDSGCVKQAMDMLPCAVCYFAPSGDVKLCNLQMHRLFHCMAQKELQTMDDLAQALGECDDNSRIVRLSDVRQTYLFPDGKVWRYSQSQVIANGTTYTEALFSDVTELYEKNLELHRQAEQLQKIAGELKQLSENVQTLAEEREILTAKTRLHDSMGSGLLAIRWILQQKTDSSENNAAVMQFRRAVEALQEENISQQYDVSEFIQDAAVSGICVEITGELPKEKTMLGVPAYFGRRFPVVLPYFPAHIVCTAEARDGGYIREFHGGVPDKFIRPRAADMREVFTGGNSGFSGEHVSKIPHAHEVFSRDVRDFYGVRIIPLNIVAHPVG